MTFDDLKDAVPFKTVMQAEGFVDQIFIAVDFTGSKWVTENTYCGSTSRWDLKD